MEKDYAISSQHYYFSKSDIKEPQPPWFFFFFPFFWLWHDTKRKVFLSLFLVQLEHPSFCTLLSLSILEYELF